MAKRVNSDALVKKLTAVLSTQDSISMLGVWIICNKHEHKLITEKWLEVLKSAEKPHQLTLLYLCNDVVQKCTRKNAEVFKKAFENVIPEAITHIRNNKSIRAGVERVLGIWKKRNVYDSEFVDQLMAMLVANRPPDILKNKLLQEYKTIGLMEDIRRADSLAEQFQSKKAVVDKLHPGDTEKLKKLKDKDAGKKYIKEVDDQRQLVRTYKELYIKILTLKKQLFENLQNGKIYYQAQYHEAKIVTRAYRNYETRLLQTQKGMVKVLERVKELHPSPPRDAPSPEPMEKPPVNEDDMDISEDEQYHTSPDENSANHNSTFEDMSDAQINLPRQLLLNAAASLDKSAVEQILRSTKMNEENSQDESSPNGYQSPPSPVGSCDLNLHSPPRHQSLDSRLADIFSAGGIPKVAEPAKEEISDTASIAEEDKEKPPPPPPPPPPVVPDLHGLGDLIQSVIASTSAKQSANSSPQPAEPRGISIPVIQSFSKSVAPDSPFYTPHDGNGTPTQDERFSPATTAAVMNAITSKPADAFAFLSNIMGAVKAAGPIPPLVPQTPMTLQSETTPSVWPPNQTQKIEETTSVNVTVNPTDLAPSISPHNDSPQRGGNDGIITSESNSNAWLAAYSPPPTENWESVLDPHSRTPPLPSDIATSLDSVKPPIPLGPEPLHHIISTSNNIPNSQPSMKPRGSRDDTSIGFGSPDFRRNSGDGLRRNSNLITLNFTPPQHTESSNNILLTPTKDRDMRGNSVNSDRGVDLLRRVDDNPLSPPPIMDHHTPNFPPPFEENPFVKSQDNVMVSLPNNITPPVQQHQPPPQISFDKPKLLSPAPQMLNTAVPVSPSPVLRSPRFPLFSTPPPTTISMRPPMKPSIGFNSRPRHNGPRKPFHRPPFNPNNNAPETKRFRLQNSFQHEQRHQHRPPRQQNRHRMPSHRMRFRNVDQTRSPRPPGNRHHRPSFPRLYNS